MGERPGESSLGQLSQHKKFVQLLLSKKLDRSKGCLFGLVTELQEFILEGGMSKGDLTFLPRLAEEISRNVGVLTDLPVEVTDDDEQLKVLLERCHIYLAELSEHGQAIESFLEGFYQLNIAYKEALVQAGVRKNQSTWYALGFFGDDDLSERDLALRDMKRDGRTTVLFRQMQVLLTQMSGTTIGDCFAARQIIGFGSIDEAAKFFTETSA